MAGIPSQISVGTVMSVPPPATELMAPATHAAAKTSNSCTVRSIPRRQLHTTALHYRGKGLATKQGRGIPMLQVVLLMSLLGAAQAPALAGQIPTHVDATALAQEGHHEAALDAFRRIAAANPRDHQARVGIARVHGLMGHPELAEPVYRSVLLEDPANLEAMRGLGATLVALGQTDD